MKYSHAIIFSLLFNISFLFSYSFNPYFFVRSNDLSSYSLSGISQQHSSSSGNQIVSVFGLARAGFKFIKSLISDSQKERHCNCIDQDLCNVKKMTPNNIQKLYKQLNEVTNLYAGQQSSFDIIWAELGLNQLSLASQDKLKERINKESSFAKASSDRQKQQEWKRQQELALQRKIDAKIARQKPVKQRFINNKKIVANYLHTIKSKHQKRASAIRKALDENFCVHYQQYKLFSSAIQLLNEYSIDTRQFLECTGNAIQQQIHQEFIDILNNGANLYSKKNGLPGVLRQVQDERGLDWFSTLGNVSFIGSSINNIGHFMLAHNIADICDGLYQIEKRRTYFSFDSSEKEYVQIEELWNSALICVGNALQKNGKKVEQFTEGVKQKAIGRPTRFVTELAVLIQHEPEIIFETAGNLILDSVHYTFDSVQLMDAFVSDPFSERTFELVSEFGNNYVEPAAKKVAYAAKVLWNMPAEEKAQELVALAIQVTLAVGAVKLVAALPAYAALATSSIKFSILDQLNKLSQLSTPIIQPGILPGGQAVLTLSAVDRLAGSLAVAAEEVIVASANVVAVAPAVIDTVSTMAFAMSDSVTDISGGSGSVTPPQIPNEELAKKIAENIEAIHKMKERGIEIHPEYERLALKGRQLLRGGRAVDAGIIHPYMSDQEAEELIIIFIREMGGKETLKKLGLEDAIIDKHFIKHILSPEIKTMVTRAGKVSKKLSGCHFIDKDLISNGSLRFETIEDVLVKKVRIFCNGTSEEKTVWPLEWTKKHAVTEIARSIKNLKKIFSKKTQSLGELKTYMGSTEIITTIDRNKRFVTSFPLSKGT